MLHTVAKLHYEGDLSQVQIAKQLGLSTATISRLLQRARAEGIVRIEVRDIHAPDALGGLLAERLGLKTVVAVDAPVAAGVQALAGPLSRVSAAMAPYRRAIAEALRSGAGAPAIWPVQMALQAYSAEVAALRGEGLTRGIASDVAERFFAIGFSLEQMRQNLKDLERCVAEWAEKVPELPTKQQVP